MIKKIAGMALAISMTAGVSSAKADDWTGAYISSALGAGAVVHNVTADIAGVGQVVDFNGIGGEGVLLSAGGGYDHQMGRVVLGGFADFDLSFIKSRLDILGVPEIDARHRHSWSLGGRAGLLVNDATLAYGLIGYTRAKFDTDFLGSQNYNGLLLGAGLETKLNDRLALRAEYRYTHFFEETRFQIPGFLSVDNEPSMHTGRVGIVYKFGGRDHHEEESHK